MPTASPRALSYLSTTALALDALVMFAVGALAFSGRRSLDFLDQSLQVSETLWLAGPMLVGWLVVIAAFGGYRAGVFGAGVEEYKIVVNASLLTAGLTGVACYVGQFSLSRGFFVLAFVVGTLALVAERGLLRRAVHRARRVGALRHDVLIAGTPSHVDEIANVLRRESWLGYHVMGALVPADDLREETACGVPVLGTPDEALQVLDSVNADIIFIAGGALDSADQMRSLVWDLEHEKVQVVVAPSVTNVARERIRIRPVGGLPLVHIDPPRWMGATRSAKRLFDLMASATLLLAFAPIFVFTSLAIKKYDRGPIFFRQVRTGRDGKEFGCLKFRTMVTDAEGLLAQLRTEQGHTAGLFKMRDDPRVTGPGRWLRRYSLDELPQLLNVFRGDMSLVGPRPPLPLEVASYEDFIRRRLHVRPGMTGLWQVSGRSDLSWDEAVRLDLYYVDNWSMLQDMSILARTLGAVMGSRGAY